MEDDHRSGRPATSLNESSLDLVKTIVREDRRQSVEDIALRVGISVGSCHDILQNHLNMHQVCSHVVPRNLTDEQKQVRCTLAGDLIDMADADAGFFNSIVTGDETLCFLYDPQQKRQST